MGREILLILTLIIGILQPVHPQGSIHHDHFQDEQALSMIGNRMPAHDDEFVFKSGDGADGPYFFYKNQDTLIVITVSADYTVQTDTIDNAKQQIYIRTPISDTTIFPIREPVREQVSVFPAPEKLFVISDMQGDYLKFIKILQDNRIADRHLNWSYGTGHLVVLGNMMNRGNYVSQLLWLIYKLEKEAPEKGGRVHFILGEDEVMNIAGHTELLNDKYKMLAGAIGMDAGTLYGPASFLGKWIRTKNVIEKIGNNLFFNGGIPESLVPDSCDVSEINALFHQSVLHQFMEPNDPFQVPEGGNKGFSIALADHLESLDATHLIIGAAGIVPDDSRIIPVEYISQENIFDGILIEGKKIYRISSTGRKLVR